MAKRTIVGGNLLEIAGYDNLESPRVSKVGESTFTEWNSSNNVWDVKSDTVFKDGSNTESFLKNYSYDLTQNTTSIINDLPADVRNKFWQENIFTPGIIGNGITSENSEAGSQQSGSTQNPASGTNPISSDKSNYRYPLKVNNGYDYLQITRYEYVPVGKNSANFTDPNTFFSPESVDNRIKSAKETITLPMQPGISEANSVNWGPDSLNPIQTFFAGQAGQAIQSISTGNYMQAATQFIDNVLNAGGQADGNNDLKNYIIQYFAGQAVGANIVTRNSGLVVNPNLELLFGGPNLRSFSYNYLMTPRDNEEAAEIKNIILLLKRNMAAVKDTNLFLKTPSVFKLKYIFGKTGNQHPFLNKIKMCALTSLNVDYTPGQNYMTYQDGSMTSYQLSLTFSELEPIYNTDFDDTDTSTMGY